MSLSKTEDASKSIDRRSYILGMMEQKKLLYDQTGRFLAWRCLYTPLKDKMFFDFELIGNKMSGGLAEPVGLVCI